MDVQEGQQLPTWVVEAVPEEKMKTMALILRDPNPIHWDVEAVRHLGLGDRVVNQGPSNVAYVMNMLIEWVGDPASLRRLRVRFLGNVFGGDRLVAGGSVRTVRSDSNGLHVADCEVWLERDGDTRVLDGTASVVLPNGRGKPDIS